MAIDRPKDNPQFATVTGQCLRVAIGDQVFTEACSGKLGRSQHSDGRTGLYFFLGEDHIVTFSGALASAKGRDAREVESLTLDQVILNPGSRKGEPQRIGAKGRCVTTQTAPATYRVACSGTLEKGTAFSASFEIKKDAG